MKRKGVVLAVAGFNSACTNGSSPSQVTPLTIPRHYGRHPFHVLRKGKVRGTRKGRGLDGGDETLSLRGRFKGGSFKGVLRFQSQNPITSCGSGRVAAQGERQK